MSTAPALGDTVRTTTSRTGVVVDKSMGEALVRMDRGDELDVSHGIWLSYFELELTGHDPLALVWRGGRMELAM